jgi:hypothetical protein
MDEHSRTLIRCHSALAELNGISASLSASRAAAANGLDAAECEFHQIDSREATRVRLRRHLCAAHGQLLNVAAVCSDQLSSISDLRSTTDQLWNRSAALDRWRDELNGDCSREDEKRAEIQGTCSMLRNVLYAKRAIALRLSRFETRSAEVFEAQARSLKVNSELESQRQANEGIERQIGGLLGASSPLFLRNSDVMSELRALVDCQRKLRDAKLEMVELQSKHRRSERALIQKIESAQSDLCKQRLRLDELKAKLVAVMENGDRALGGSPGDPASPSQSCRRCKEVSSKSVNSVHVEITFQSILGPTCPKSRIFLTS